MGNGVESKKRTWSEEENEQRMAQHVMSINGQKVSAIRSKVCMVCHKTTDEIEKCVGGDLCSPGFAFKANHG